MVLRGALWWALEKSQLVHPAAGILLFQAHTLVVLARPRTHHTLTQQHEEFCKHLSDYFSRNNVRAEGREWSITISSVVSGGNWSGCGRGARNKLDDMDNDFKQGAWYSFGTQCCSCVTCKIGEGYSFWMLLMSSGSRHSLSQAVPGGAIRSHSAQTDNQSGRCILHGQIINIANPEGLRRRLRMHVAANDTQPRLRPRPIDYMSEEPHEERMQAANELLNLRDSIVQQLPATDYWKHLIHTPGRRQELETEQTLDGEDTEQRPSGGAVLPDGTGQGYVRANTFTQWNTPVTQLVRMEEDYRAIFTPLEHFRRLNVLEIEDEYSRPWVRLAFMQLREVLEGCVNQRDPWTQYGEALRLTHPRQQCKIVFRRFRQSAWRELLAYPRDAIRNA
eukprot:2770907-Amphidinium_carterae.2